jgi:hypothetical protein
MNPMHACMHENPSRPVGSCMVAVMSPVARRQGFESPNVHAKLCCEFGLAHGEDVAGSVRFGLTKKHMDPDYALVCRNVGAKLSANRTRALTKVRVAKARVSGGGRDHPRLLVG